ncbi:DNA-directed RNA polymerase subunit delta [Allofustis seminis]|uniref:DNA-directed RNA polymerase subunit delta n=1 Tax=Allofustis seminis TaxID=166939 RepID=UPI00036C3E36|nr:DNA-directed RNA polymerase subunit delta [Allofustis seminis]
MDLFNQIYDKRELSMLDVAKMILVRHGDIMDFNDLLAEIAEFLELDDDQLESEMAQFYTDLNTDGQFISLGDNLWGLRNWYPFESINEVLTQENTEEDITPRRSSDGFDDYDSLFEQEEKEALDEEDSDELDEETEKDEDLDAYRDDLDDLEEDSDELEDLEIEDDEDVLADDEDDDDLI